MPPFIIYDAKNLNMEWTKEEVSGTTYRLSDNGWIDMELLSSGSIVTLCVMLEQIDPYYFC